MQKKIIFRFILLFVITVLYAQAPSATTFRELIIPGVPLPAVNSKSAAVIDAATGTYIFLQNPDEEIPPASLTKLMTIHLALSEVKAGRANLEMEISPPRESWAINQPPRSSLMFLADGQRATLNDLILGLAVPSGNDAAVAVALTFAPSVRDFTDMMNNEARALGMTVTRFDEPSGISEYNMTTAREFVQFCRFYINTHPETLMNYHSVPEFAYPKPENVAPVFRSRPGTIIQPNRNQLLKTVEGVDGLKTGYIDEAGYNIALTASRNETRFIAVIMGAPLNGGDRIRDEDGRRLINWAFENFKTVRPPMPDPVSVRVWKGKTDYVIAVPDEPLEFTAQVNRAVGLYTMLELNEPLIAPLPAGTRVGDLVYYDSMGELRRVPLVTVQEIESGNFFKQAIDSVQLFFKKK